MNQLPVYKMSGRWGAGSIIVPLVAIMAAALLAIAYSYANVYSPVAGYVSVVLVFLFAFGVGACICGAGIASKCRSKTFVAAIGFGAAVLALYTSWVVFLYALMRRSIGEEFDVSMADMFADPGGVWEIIKVLNGEGWYTVFSNTPRGITLWAFWVIEAGIILVIVPVSSIIWLDDRVFCERTGKWCQAIKNRFSLQPGDDESMLQRIAGGDLDALSQLWPADAATAPALRVNLFTSADPEGARAMQVKLLRIDTDNKGNQKENLTDLTPIFLLTNEQYQWVEQLADRPVEMSTPKSPEASPEDHNGSVADGSASTTNE